MEIDERHHKAAKLLAKGATELKTAAAVGVGKSTITRWKSKDQFKALIIRYAEPLRAEILSTAHPESLDLFEKIPDSESALISDLQAIVAKLSGTVLKRLEALTDDEVEEIPTRLIPGFVKAFTEALEALQRANDRHSGYELVITELGKIIDEKPSSRKT